MKQLEQFIQSQGWSFYGITDIKTLDSTLRKHKIFFDEWIKKGYEADMDYLKRMEADRFNPENKLPDVKSVIVLGAVYSDGGSNGGSNGGPQYEPQERSDTSHNASSYPGAVARYARGNDYHKILKKKLIELSDWLKLQPTNYNLQTYVSVDSGPTADRVLAECAGLGFFGKNCNIINPSSGSYFFIASLMTNLELSPTPVGRMPNCGDCQKCQKSCPTGALVAPHTLDARKCISYLTIENKGGIPEDLRPKIGNRLFGCDACQECCPFNERKQDVLIDQFKSEYGAGESLDLKDILSIKSDEEFAKKFAGTSVMRAKRRGLLRNACIVAGNSGDKTLIPYLKELIDREKDDMLKEHAEWAIKQLKKN
jgi:epoxyqueuosine reductase